MAWLQAGAKTLKSLPFSSRRASTETWYPQTRQTPLPGRPKPFRYAQFFCYSESWGESPGLVRAIDSAATPAPQIHCHRIDTPLGASGKSLQHAAHSRMHSSLSEFSSFSSLHQSTENATSWWTCSTSRCWSMRGQTPTLFDHSQNQRLGDIHPAHYRLSLTTTLLLKR